MGRPGKKKKTLRHLSKAELDEADHDRLRSEIAESSDRAAAILAAIEVEKELRSLLLCSMESIDDATEEALFGGIGPLATFSAKILLGTALGLFPAWVREDMDGIRHIRNAFAHTLKPIDFQTKEIAEAADRLNSNLIVAKHARRLFVKLGWRQLPCRRLLTRAYYTECCAIISAGLNALALTAIEDRMALLTAEIERRAVEKKTPPT